MSFIYYLIRTTLFLCGFKTIIADGKKWTESMVEEWKTLHVAEELPTELDTRNKTEMLTQ